MKKFLCAALASLMLLGGSATAFADDAAAAPTSLTLADTSHLVLDTEAGYVDKIDGTVTVAELKANFASAITVKKDGGDAKADDAFVATDDVVAAADNSLKALIYGDVDRTGKINLTDVSATMKHIAKWNPGINEDAADVDKTGIVNLQDASKILRVIAGWPDLSLGNVRLVFENKPLTSDTDYAGLDLYFVSPMLKTGRSNITSTGEHSYKMSLARREAEACQLFLVSDADMEGVTLEITDFEYEWGGVTLTTEIFRGHYYDFSVFNQIIPRDYNNVTTDEYPLVQIPNETSFELEAGMNQQFMIQVTSDENTPAGMYRATVSVKDSDGKVLRQAYVYANVWDFTLPVATSSASAFGLNKGTVLGLDKSYDGTNGNEVYAKYYEFLLDYNLTPSELPYDVLDERADAYMDDPRVTSFRTFPEMATFALTDYFGEGNIRENVYDPEEMADRLVAYMEKINANPVWAEKSYFTIIDEPIGLDMFNRIKNVDDWMREALDDEDGSEFNLMLCLAGDDFYDQANLVDAVQFLIEGDYLDIWCPQSYAFTHTSDVKYEGSSLFGTRPVMNKYGTFAERMVPELEAGKKLWWYICCAPMIPYPNYFAYYQGVANRVVLWQQYMFGAEGILYWDTVYLLGGPITKHNYGTDGDGQLIFVGDFYGSSGPIPSWRLFQVRDSFDDFDYLTIAEELCGREAVDKVLSTVTTSILNYTEDYRVMEAARLELAKMILEAQGE